MNRTHEGPTYVGPSREESDAMRRGEECRRGRHEERLAACLEDLLVAGKALAQASTTVGEAERVRHLLAHALGLLADYRHGIPPAATGIAKRAADDLVRQGAAMGIAPRRVFS